MNVIDWTVVFVRDLGLFFIYCCGHCVRFFFECIISWKPFIWGTNSIITVYRTLLLVPFHILMKVGLQLCLLPVNLPLRILLGTSIKDILLQATSRSDAYIFTAILQYCLVLAIYGVSIGGLCGTFLGVINTLWRIPDIYIEIPIKFWKYMQFPPLWLKKSLPLYSGAITQLYGKDTKCNNAPPSPPLASSSQPPEPSQCPLSVESVESEPATPKSGADFTLRPKHPSASRESILKVASILPSDFFQQDQPEENFYEENQQYLSPNRSHSSQPSTQNSSVEFTNLWDRIEDSPVTLRTEDGLNTLSRRKNLLDANSNEKLTTK